MKDLNAIRYNHIRSYASIKDLLKYNIDHLFKGLNYESSDIDITLGQHLAYLVINSAIIIFEDPNT